MSDKRTRDRVIEALVQRLVTARSFDEANSTASRLSEVKTELSISQIRRLVDASDENNQVTGAWHAKSFVDGLATTVKPVREQYGPDEAPF